MEATLIPSNEDARLATLARLGVLDTPPEERYDRLVRIAVALFQVPIAHITLVDADRTWAKASASGRGWEQPRTTSICAHTILSDQPLVISDALMDDRFADHPMVTGKPHLRFYAGHPLSIAGQRVGTLCIFDRVPRTMDGQHLDMLADLAHLVEAELSNRGLAEAQAELEQLSRVKSDVVSIVSHEFRTALTGIQGFSEMMKDGSFSSKEMREFAADIHKDALRLNRMITEMLDLDRMESGRLHLDLERLDFNTVVAEETDLVRARSLRHTILLELDPGLPPIHADNDKLRQVMANLLSNATKYSPENSTITVRTGTYGPMVRVSIVDQGVGIAREHHESIFQRYGRVQTAQTRKIRGTGLGLPIVRQIALLHGGRVWVESTPGFGSTFHFSLPVAGPDSTLEATD